MNTQNLQKNLTLTAVGLLILGLGVAGGVWWTNRSSGMASAVTESAKSERKVLYWYDPMVPTQRFDKPGKSPFMNMQLEPVYGELLSRYGRLLRQRSQLLRRGLGGKEAHALLDAFDLQMAVIGTRLHRRRSRALRRLEPLAALWQQRLSGGREVLELHYQSGTRLEGEEAEEPWREALEAQLAAQRDEEWRLGQCSVGPHRDEIGLLLGGQPARRYGSAGQQRTLVLALKLAELELVGAVVGAPPVLLLDDVLAELDPGRQQLLLEAVGEGHQCLVSATHLEAFDKGWQQNSQVIRMQAGEIEAGT